MECARIEMTQEVHQHPWTVGMLLHEIGSKRFAETVPAQLWRHFEPCSSGFLHDDIQVVPHRLVTYPLAALCEEKCGLGPGVGKVRADMFFVDAHGSLGKRCEDRLT